MGTGMLPIVVFVVIVAVGLFILRKPIVPPETRNKPQPVVPVDDRIYTTWGYSFPAEYEFYPADARSCEQLLIDLKKLLMTHFKDCKIYYQVPASALNPSAHPACVPVSFLLEKANGSRLAIFLVASRNYKGRNVVATKEICSGMGIPWIQFFEEYANDDDYVVARIRHYLG